MRAPSPETRIAGNSGGWRLIATALPRVLIGLALVAFVGYFVVYSLFAVSLFQFPFDYDQGEGFELKMHNIEL